MFLHPKATYHTISGITAKRSASESLGELKLLEKIPEGASDEQIGRLLKKHNYSNAKIRGISLKDYDKDKQIRLEQLKSGGKR